MLAIFVAVPAITPSTVFAQGAAGQNPGQLVDEAWQVINKDFVDPTFHHHDWLKTRQEFLSKKYGNTKEAHAAIADMVKQLDDPQTRLMSQAELASTLQEFLALEVKGDFCHKVQTICERGFGSTIPMFGHRLGDGVLVTSSHSSRRWVLTEW